MNNKEDKRMKLICLRDRCCWRTVDGLCSRRPCPFGMLRTTKQVEDERRKAFEAEVRERRRRAALKSCDKEEKA